jgi:hypothetical protein
LWSPCDLSSLSQLWWPLGNSEPPEARTDPFFPHADMDFIVGSPGACLCTNYKTTREHACLYRVSRERSWLLLLGTMGTCKPRCTICGVLNAGSEIIFLSFLTWAFSSDMTSLPEIHCDATPTTFQSMWKSRSRHSHTPHPTVPRPCWLWQCHNFDEIEQASYLTKPSYQVCDNDQVIVPLLSSHSPHLHTGYHCRIRTLGRAYFCTYTPIIPGM